MGELIKNVASKKAASWQQNNKWERKVQNKKIKNIGCTVALALVAATSPALAEYTERPIRFVVPWPPGDIEDTLTRMIADVVRDETGVPTSTVNIAGGGLVGATHVFSQPAGGYTIGVFTADIVSVHIMRGNAIYDRAEFEPIAGVIGYGQVLAAAADAPFNNLVELAEHAKSNDLTLGVVGLNARPSLQVRKMAETLDFKFASIAGCDETSCQLLFNGEVNVLLGGATMRP